MNKHGERIANILFGISLIYWAYAGFVLHFDNSSIPIVRIFISLLNFTIGLLILFRKFVIINGSLKSILISLPSLLLGASLFKLALPISQWSIYSSSFFIFGAIITIISFLFLGRNFAIFPSRRQIVSNGLYSIIRHPSYLGEMIMISVCALAAESYLSLFIFLLFIPAMVFRINTEEELLLQDIEYLEYCIDTKWRLIPFIW